PSATNARSFRSGGWPQDELELANAGTTRNMIPPAAQAVADVRVVRVADYDAIEKKVRERIKKQLLPEAKVAMNFERRRPPLEATAASRALGKHAQQIYR